MPYSSFVLKDHPGTGIANLRNLAISLARDAIFGKEEMMSSSLSCRKNTTALDKKKLSYIKTIIQSRVLRMSETEFASLWILYRSSISKSCQGFCTSPNGNCISYLTSNNVTMNLKMFL